MKYHMIMKRLLLCVLVAALALPLVCCGADTPVGTTAGSETETAGNVGTTSGEPEKTDAETGKDPFVTTDEDPAVTNVGEDPVVTTADGEPEVLPTLSIYFLDEEVDYDAKTQTLTLEVGERVDVVVETDPQKYRYELTYVIGDPSVLGDMQQSYVSRFFFNTLAVGTSTVTFSAHGGSVVLNVTVKAKEEPPVPEEEYLTVTGSKTVLMGSGNLSLTYETNFEESATYPRRLWKSDNPSVLYITDSFNGIAVPTSPGTATLSVTLINGSKQITGSAVFTVSYPTSDTVLDLPKTPEKLEKASALMPLSVNSYLAAFMKTEEFYALEMTPENVEKAKVLLAEAADLWQTALGDACLLEGVAEKVISEIDDEREKNPIPSLLSVFRPVYLASGNAESLAWAEALTKKFDAYQGAGKIAQLAKDMGTDCKKAYKALTMAQNIIAGEAMEDEFFWETCQIVAEATKTSCKVGVYTCATLTTLGVGTAAVGAAGTAGAAGSAVTAIKTVSTAKKIMDVGGIAIGGVDCLLEVGKEGSKIILGEDHEVTVALNGTADDFSNVSFLWGLSTYKASDTFDRVQFLTDTALNLFFEKKIGSFKLDFDSKKIEARQEDVRDPATKIPSPAERTPEQIVGETQKHVVDENHDQKIEDLNIPDAEEITKTMEELLEEEWNQKFQMSQYGLLYLVEGEGYRYYVDEGGKKFGEYVRFNAATGEIYSKDTYIADKLNGWCEKYSDGIIADRYYFVDDVKHGPFERYVTREGKAVLFENGTYKNGLEDGLITYYEFEGENVGAVKATYDYTAGKIDGHYRQYLDGHLVKDWCYTDGIANGYSYDHFYNSPYDVCTRSSYLNGKLMEKLEYYYTDYPDGYYLREEYVSLGDGYYYYKLYAYDGLVTNEGKLDGADSFANRCGIWIYRERAGDSIIVIETNWDEKQQ